MNSVLAIIMLGGMIVSQITTADAQSQMPDPQLPPKSFELPTDLPALNSAHHGKSTLLGGSILSVDPVRDELTLRVVGMRPLRILFDEYTAIYRDGNKSLLRNVAPGDHASVQTMLSGTDVYALSIHVLSEVPEGEYQGRVLRYNHDTGEVTIASVGSGNSINLFVPSDTPVVQAGQSVFTSTSRGLSDLVEGAVISVRFESDKKGRGIVSRISVLATPGSVYEFSGNLSALDMHSGILDMVDSVDNMSYQIAFDPVHPPISESLHLGDHVSVTASFDGTHYTASTIHVN
jgi:hypothetical protein